MDFELLRQRVTLDHVNGRKQKVTGGEMRPAADLTLLLSLTAGDAGILFMGGRDALQWAWQPDPTQVEGTAKKLTVAGASIGVLPVIRTYTGMSFTIHSAMEAGPDLVALEGCKVDDVKVTLEENELVKVSLKVKAGDLTAEEIGELHEQWCNDEITVSLFQRQQEAPLSHKDASTPPAKGKKRAEPTPETIAA